jgi:nucleotide-binding universal stress UspA family protein
MKPVQIRKIVFPVDFSERCAGAANYVEDFAGRFQSELTLIHAIPSPATTWRHDLSPAELDAEQSRHQSLRTAAEARIENFLAEELKHFDVTRVILEGDPAAVTLDYAGANGIDLIMMPTHSFGPFRYYIIGSNTSKVLHDASCPVWTGAHLERAPRLDDISFHTVLCAVDLRPHSAKALAWAAGFAAEHGAALHLVHAIPEVPPYPDVRQTNEITAYISRLANEQLLALKIQAGLEAESHVEAGEPSTVIQALASRLNADLVVIARGSAAGGLGRLRANAYAIIRSSPCPVVSV